MINVNVKGIDNLISIISCISSDSGLGNNNALLFNIKNDLKRFQQLTKNQIVVMGTRTFESIVEMNGKPLPNRVNVVLTRNKSYQPQFGEFVFHDVESILKHCKTLNDDIDKKVFIIGGGQVYASFLEHTNEILLTIVNKHVEADAFYPMHLQDELGFIPIEESEEFYTEEYDAYYKFVRYTKANEIEGGVDDGES